MDNIVTIDLSRFGYRELALAADLLMAYAQEGSDFLGDEVTLNFNTNSGVVFLTDEDYNVGVLEDDKLVQFFVCPECGEEGTLAEFESNIDDHEIKDGEVIHGEATE